MLGTKPLPGPGLPGRAQEELDSACDLSYDGVMVAQADLTRGLDAFAEQFRAQMKGHAAGTQSADPLQAPSSKSVLMSTTGNEVPGPPHSNCSILVVEDDPGTRELVADILLLAGYSSATASNGAEALRRVEHHCPSLVLLDLHLPVVDGRQFAADDTRILV